MLAIDITTPAGGVREMPVPAMFGQPIHSNTYDHENEPKDGSDGNGWHGLATADPGNSKGTGKSR